MMNILYAFVCVSYLFGAADDDIKKEFPQEHIAEVKAAHRIAHLVFSCIEKKREEKKIYYSDERNEAFEGYVDGADEFHIQKGLVLCVQNMIPGKLYTRWGVWHFAQNRCVLVSDIPEHLWQQYCNEIIDDESITLNEIDVPALVQADQAFVVRRMDGVKLLYPLQEDNSVEVLQGQGRQAFSVRKQLSEYVVDPVKKFCGEIKGRLSSLPFLSKQPVVENQVKPYRPPSRDRARSYPPALSQNELYWQKLSNLCKED